MAAGFGHTCSAIEGELYCWGFNHKGQTDTKNMFNVYWVGAGVEHSCAMQLVDSRLVCWGVFMIERIPEQIK